MNLKKLDFEVKALDESGVIEGYGAAFGNVDLGNDVIVRGAFAKGIASAKSLPAMCWQHDMSSPIGVWKEISEDDNGLRVKGQLCLDTQAGKEAYALLKMGALKGLSIGYGVDKGGSSYRKDGVRELKELSLHEVSLVTVPMNPQANITAVKAGSRNSAADRARLSTAHAALWEAMDNSQRGEVYAAITASMDSDAAGGTDPDQGEEEKDCCPSCAGGDDCEKSCDEHDNPVKHLRALEKSLRDAGQSRKDAKAATATVRDAQALRELAELTQLLTH
jgi:HK97 family phage prohead protease